MVIRVFLCGPFHNSKKDKVFDTVEKHYINLEYEVVNPIKALEELKDLMGDKTPLWEDRLAWNLFKIRDCDAIAFLPDWYKVSDCLIQALFAKELDLIELKDFEFPIIGE